MPSRRVPPDGLAISTRRTGLGVKRPASNLAARLSQCRSTWARNCPVVIPSIPAAPPLATTAFSASRAFSALTTCSITLSCIAFCPRSCSKLHSPSARSGPPGFTLPPHLCRPRTATSSVAPLPLRTASQNPETPNLALHLVLRPFAPPGFHPASSLLWPLLTSPRLSSGSPPQVRRLHFLRTPPDSTLVPRQPSGFAVPSQLARHFRPLCLFVSLRPRICLPLPSASQPCVQLRLLLSAPTTTYTWQVQAHAGHTRSPPCGRPLWPGRPRGGLLRERGQAGCCALRQVLERILGARLAGREPGELAGQRRGLTGDHERGRGHARGLRLPADIRERAGNHALPARGA